MVWMYIYSGLVVLGVVVFSNFGAKLGESLGASKEKLSWMTEARSRKIGGLLLLMFGGFIASIDLFWIHNKYMEYSGITTANTAFNLLGLTFDTSALVGDLQNNHLFGIPWGFGGMLFFAISGWFALSIQREPVASWVSLLLKSGVYLSVLAVLASLYLVYIEMFILEGTYSIHATIIQLTIFFSLMMFISLQQMNDEGNWIGQTSEETAVETQRKSRSRGYVAPIIDSEE